MDAAAEVVAQQLSGRAAVGHHAAGVDRELRIRNADFTQELHQHRDAFGVDERGDPADVFDADLVELPPPSGRRALAAEHRAVVVDPLFDAVQHVGVGQGAHHAGGSFGAQRQAASAAVEKGVHLFLHDFGFVAEAALEHFGVLENRSAQLAVTVS